MKIRTIIYVVVLVGLISCKKNDNVEKDIAIESHKFQKTTVQTKTIVLQDFEKQSVFNGKVFSRQKNDLFFKTSNILTRVSYANGDMVKKGSIIASLDNGILKNQLEKNKIYVLNAENKLQKEKISYGFWDKKEHEIPKGVLKNIQISSGILTARNNFERTKIEYEQSFLRAPFSGIIANIEKKEGDFITNSELFCSLINPSDLEVIFSVLENEYATISKNLKLKIKLFGKNDKEFDGVISEINPIVDDNGLIKVKAKINSINTGLLDGMNVKVIVNELIKNVIVIPKEAMVLRSNKEVVFTVEDDLVKWNYVDLIEENIESYLINKGLQSGDSIIISNNQNLSHDTKVIIDND